MRISSAAPRARKRLADDADGRYRAVLKNENFHGLLPLPLKIPGDPEPTDETPPRPKSFGGGAASGFR